MLQSMFRRTALQPPQPSTRRLRLLRRRPHRPGRRQATDDVVPPREPIARPGARAAAPLQRAAGPTRLTQAATPCRDAGRSRRRPRAGQVLAAPDPRDVPALFDGAAAAAERIERLVREAFSI